MMLARFSPWLILCLGIVTVSMTIYSAPKVSPVETIPHTDDGCFIQRRHAPEEEPPIFYHLGALGYRVEIGMNINGIERELKWKNSDNDDDGRSHYQSGNYDIAMNWGIAEPNISQCGDYVCGSGTTLNHAEIIVRDGRFETRIPARGWCGYD